MMQKLFLSFSLVFLFSISSIAQSYRVAFEQINELKDGALVVRLFQKEKSIEALKNVGRIEEANRIESEIWNDNQTIIDSVNYYFSFCPVYYIYSQSSNSFKQKDWDNVQFLDSVQQPIDSITFNYETVFTASFSALKNKSRDNNSSAFTRGLSAFFFMDDQFVQLQQPFPFFTRTYTTFPKLRPLGVVVKKMNSKLEQFYQQANNLIK